MAAARWIVGALSVAAIVAAAATPMAPPPPLSSPLLSSLFTASLSPPATLHTYDLRYVRANYSVLHGYEEIHLVTVLGGLVNRAAPALYTLSEPADSEWLSLLMQRGGWLENTTLLPVLSLPGLLSTFRSSYGGVVLYDADVWSTSAVATTIAAADDLLPIAYRPGDTASLYSRLIAAGPRLPVEFSLVGMFNGNVTGSVKRDVYAWATEHYLRSGVSDGAFLGYYVDSFWASHADASGWDKHTITNMDWFVARRGFFFDLACWDDEAPVDDPHQPLGSDLAAFKEMLAAAYAQSDGAVMTHIGGFTPWAYKYVTPNGKHGGVDTEWQTSELTTAYNAFVDADACCIGNMANAAVFTHYPLADRYTQRPPPSADELRARGFLAPNGSVVGGRLYYMWYAGDYDSAAWLYSQLLARWNDPVRGGVSIGWAVDPELALRFPPIFPLLLDPQQSTASDVLISGDSGAGYVNPTALYGPDRARLSGLPDGVSLWQRWNTDWNRQFGISFTGFAITGFAPHMDSQAEAMYVNFSAGGLVNQGWPGLATHLTANMPVFVQSDVPSDVGDAAAAIATKFNASQRAPQFWMFRSVLTSPSFLKNVTDAAAARTGGGAIAVDPLTLGTLARVALGGSLDNRVSYTADTLPDAAPPGAVLPFTVTIRNDGWNALRADGHALLVSVTSVQALHRRMHVLEPRRRQRAAAERASARQQLGEEGTGVTAADSVTGAADAPAAAALLRPLRRPGSRLQRWLDRAEYAGQQLINVHAATGTATAAVRDLLRGVTFPLPADLSVSGSVTVPASLIVPLLRDFERRPMAGEEGERAPLLITVTYQLCSRTGTGRACNTTFDALGNIAWVHDILVQ